MMYRKIKLFLLALITFMQTHAQEVERPPMWGIAKMTFWVSDFEVARDYYGNFLGFEESFSYVNKYGQTIVFKVNDRQFLEFAENKEAKEMNRLISYSIETDDVPQMERYLRQQQVKVLQPAQIDAAGNETLLAQAPSGIHLEFIDFKDEGLHRQSKGRFLGKERISTRIHHAGLYTDSIPEADQFYQTILGLKEFWRFKTEDDVKPNFVYLRIPDCVENIEYVYGLDQNCNHPCFLVDDMQETIYQLKERANGKQLAKPIIGKGNRWLLNLKNSDDTRVEFTEAHTIQ